MSLQLEPYLGRKPRSHGPQRGTALAQAIVDTVREPLVVLDRNLRVIAASRSFYLTFHVTREDTQWRPLYELGDGQWDIPDLRHLLEEIVPKHTVVTNYEVEHDFPSIGRRIMLLNARTVFDKDNACSHLLLAIEDVTERREAERKVQHRLVQKELSLTEMQHRISNSLQIIASIVQLKASTVQSEESRSHLLDVHMRVLSVAAVQEHLNASDIGERIAVAPYLSKLCETLGQWMISGRSVGSVSVAHASGTVPSGDAGSIGLIVTECVINAFKHAFSGEEKNGRIVVACESNGSAWKLSVTDDGIGKCTVGSSSPSNGPGTSILNALARQLDARVDTVSHERGTTVSITHNHRPSQRHRKPNNQMAATRLARPLEDDLIPGDLATQNQPVFGPNRLKALQNCFDEAWQAIDRNFAYENVDAARSKLAVLLIDFARVGRLGSCHLGQRASATLALRAVSATRIASLTARQRQILEHVLAGHPSKNIAVDLCISQRTVDNHRATIMRKTCSKSLAALVRTALAAI